MAAAHTATVTSEGPHKVVRLPTGIRLQGTVSVREIEETGEVVLTPIATPPEPTDTWAAFLDDMASRPRDPDFMKERQIAGSSPRST